MGKVGIYFLILLAGCVLLNAEEKTAEVPTSSAELIPATSEQTPVAKASEEMKTEDADEPEQTENGLPKVIANWFSPPAATPEKMPQNMEDRSYRQNKKRREDRRSRYFNSDVERSPNLAPGRPDNSNTPRGYIQDVTIRRVLDSGYAEENPSSRRRRNSN